jgi:hypothetical protein
MLFSQQAIGQGRQQQVNQASAADGELYFSLCLGSDHYGTHQA